MTIGELTKIFQFYSRSSSLCWYSQGDLDGAGLSILQQIILLTPSHLIPPPPSHPFQFYSRSSRSVLLYILVFDYSLFFQFYSRSSDANVIRRSICEKIYLSILQQIIHLIKDLPYRWLGPLSILQQIIGLEAYDANAAASLRLSILQQII